MAIFDAPGKITEVLLADGWHEVLDRSFRLDAETGLEFAFIARFVERDDGITRVWVGGLKDQLLAVKRDPRAEGQLERRRVQPDGHWQVRLADGWHDLWGEV